MIISKIVRRIAFTLVSLLIISILSFALIEFAPGSPLDRYAENPRISQADRERIAKRYGFDQPAHIRYLIWSKNFVQGDLGISYLTGRPVQTEIMERLPATLKLMIVSFFLSVLISIPVGIYSAMHRHSLLDNILTTCSFLGISMPGFFFGLLLIYLLSITMQVLPAGGQITPWFDPTSYPPLTRPFVTIYEHGRHLLMPALVLSLANIAHWSRFMRSSMTDVISKDYIRTARAKGAGYRVVVYKHALRNALTPIITLIGMDLPSFFAGAAITEQVFSWPGMGRLFINSIGSRDYQVILGITMITAVLVLLGNLLSDLLYLALDPRVKYEG